MIDPFSKRPSINDFFPSRTFFMPRTLPSSDVEMPDSSNSDSEPDTPEQVCFVPGVAGLQVGLEKASFKGRQHV